MAGKALFVKINYIKMENNIVLRFRNLGIPNTVEAHLDKITEYKKVWWGWWNKEDEYIPRDVLAELNIEIASNGFAEIFLIDSGNKILYTAKLIEINESKTEETIQTPNEKLTPDYYSKNPHKIWFCFTEIKKIDSNIIQKWAYRKVDKFTEDKYESHFENKMVFDLDEMLSRIHRTIYFIKTYDPANHKSHKLELVPPFEFENFSINPIIGKSNYILHISDLHYGECHGFPLESDQKINISLVDAIYNDVISMGLKSSPSFIIVSGDFTCKGDASEFETAASALNYLRVKFQMEIQNFIVLPGNHDITWQADEKEKEIKKVLEKEEANYREFYEKFFMNNKPNEFLSMGRRLILNNFISLDIIGFNSCMLEQSGFQGYGFIGHKQLYDAFLNMKWNEEKLTNLRLCVLHHHLVPVIDLAEKIDEKDRTYSLTLDAGNVVKNLILKSVDLVLHGHKHEPSAISIARSTDFKKNYSFENSLNIVSAGSAGCKRDYSGPIGKNSYNIIEISKTQLRVKRRAMSGSLEKFDDYGEDLVYTYNVNGTIEPVKE